ncbi:hypothetical protein ACFOU2_19745 [Bacillus songklensis]|uniref:Uncharacterized protein n=1 Tax=Bacillus songklensis TaxID=1069116 RepID=A0ABV8B7X5_9BACI
MSEEKNDGHEQTTNTKKSCEIGSEHIELNEVIDVIKALNDRGLLKLSDDDAKARDGCTRLCSCNLQMCGCHGTVSKLRDSDTLNFDEFLELRKERLKFLKQELQDLEIPERLLKKEDEPDKKEYRENEEECEDHDDKEKTKTGKTSKKTEDQEDEDRCDD